MLESITLRCPYCGERIETLVDASEGAANYVEDCPVCCRPIEIELDVDSSGNARGVSAGRDG